MDNNFSGTKDYQDNRSNAMTEATVTTETERDTISMEVATFAGIGTATPKQSTEFLLHRIAC
jgi:hypothetical protein